MEASADGRKQAENHDQVETFAAAAIRRPASATTADHPASLTVAEVVEGHVAAEA